MPWSGRRTRQMERAKAPAVRDDNVQGSPDNPSTPGAAASGSGAARGIAMIKSPLAIRVGRALCTFLVAVAVIGPAASALAANIQTDLFIYQNGDTVTVTGDGFGATETVDVVTTDPNSTVVDSGSAASDELGNFTYQFTLNVTIPGLYTATGTGETSALTASTQLY